MNEVEEKLSQIEGFLRERYYPYILESIEGIYDRVQGIYNRSNTMSILLTEINEQNCRINEIQNQIGTKISENDFEALVSTVCDKISEYEELEKQVIEDTNVLYEDVIACVNENENNAKSTVIPLSRKEAEIMLQKQDLVINDLQSEIGYYQRMSENISSEIVALQEKNRQLDKQPAQITLKERESTRDSLLWLYSLKRIVNHTVGIQDISSENSIVQVQFSKGATLRIEIDDQDNTMNASLSNQFSDPTAENFVKIQSEFQSILDMSIGQEWTVLTKNTMYLLFSVDRLLEEIQAIQCKYTVSTGPQGLLHIAFPNFVVMEIALPLHYPRTMDKISISNISSSELNQSLVFDLKSKVRNKQFFSITDLMDYVEQIMFNSL